MDPKQEQQEELEILEATYPDEVEVLCRDHPNIKLSVKIPSAPVSFPFFEFLFLEKFFLKGKCMNNAFS